jgi:hypothetical protein
MCESDRKQFLEDVRKDPEGASRLAQAFAPA